MMISSLLTAALTGRSSAAAPEIRLSRPPALDPPFDSAASAPATSKHGGGRAWSDTGHAAVIAAPDVTAAPTAPAAADVPGRAAVPRRPAEAAAPVEAAAGPGAPAAGRAAEPAGVPGTGRAKIAARGEGAAGSTGPGSPARAAAGYVRLCVEVFNGYRPAAHLHRVAGPVALDAVVMQLRQRNVRAMTGAPTRGDRPGNAAPARYAGRRSTARPRIAPAVTAQAVTAQAVTAQAAATQTGAAEALTAEALTAQASTLQAGAVHAGIATGTGPQLNTRFPPLSVQRIRVAEPRDGIAEVVAVLAGERRSFALALRLERHGTRWLCALAQVI